MPDHRPNEPGTSPAGAAPSAAALSGAALSETAVDERGVATLSIRGTHRLNIIGSAAIADATRDLEALSLRDDVRVLILRGPADSFIGGADIDEMASLDSHSALRFIRGLASLCEALRQFPRPVIARLAGWCLGGGLEVAASCDLRIAAGDARFGMPEVLVGIPSVIHAALLPRLIGQSRSTWLLTTGEAIDAVRAEQWGLVHEIADGGAEGQAGALDRAVNRLAGRLAGLGPAVLAQQKRLLRSWEDQPLAQSIEQSVAEFGAAFESGEPQHYMGEFLARRRPRAAS